MNRADTTSSVLSFSRLQSNNVDFMHKHSRDLWPSCLVDLNPCIIVQCVQNK